MKSLRPSPGPDAHRAFRTGIRVATVAALAGIGLLYWTGVISIQFASFMLVVFFPVYLLVAASVLSKWLGFGKDMTDLRRVRRDQSAQSLWDDDSG